VDPDGDGPPPSPAALSRSTSSRRLATERADARPAAESHTADPCRSDSNSVSSVEAYPTTTSIPVAIITFSDQLRYFVRYVTLNRRTLPAPGPFVCTGGHGFPVPACVFQAFRRPHHSARSAQTMSLVQSLIPAPAFACRSTMSTSHPLDISSAACDSSRNPRLTIPMQTRHFSDLPVSTYMEPAVRSAVEVSRRAPARSTLATVATAHCTTR